MSNPDTLGLNEAARPYESAREDRIEKRFEPLPRLVGSPLPVGDGGRPQPANEVARPPLQMNNGRSPAIAAALPQTQPAPQPIEPEPEQERAMATSTASQSPVQAPPVHAKQAAPENSGMQRAFQALRSAVPYVQKILPLLDGNFATAFANILAPHPHPAPPPPPPVDLEPLTQSLTELRTQQRDLRVQIIDQNSSLKRVEDQLEMVREATDRNTLEQQELIEDLSAVGNKVNMFALIALGLLAASIALNVVLYLRLHHG